MKWIIAALLAVSMAAGWYGYQGMTDETHAGMSIIPEKHDDIPLYEGLEPQRSHYTVPGDKWREIRSFYVENLPELGWRLTYEGSALDDNDPGNDSSGFMTIWRKEGFDGELQISGGYNPYEKATEIMFDKTGIVVQTPWLESIPDSICIYEDETADDCAKTEDQDIIRVLTGFVNEGIDHHQKTELDNVLAVIDFGDLEVKVAQPHGKEVYLQSGKGLKVMKPEPEFLTLLE
ncbi:hypothetical protein [Indiicoccus explosivorum]|uniref:hypothetical protein n=1 Tax=Indiicoccus explosivorum TaxID=1917864 RepID=UPI000B42F197|nr:hypothetical protein [Indiicoccus explosivorum]